VKNKRTLIVIAIVATLIAVVAGKMILSQKTLAPDVALTTLSGKPLSLQQLRGKVVLVNFWATTCTTCVSEMPQMAETYKTFAPRGYDMVAVAMNYDRPDWVINFTQQHALPFTVALDLKGEVAQAFGGVRLTPSSFLIDKQGRIVQQILGKPDFVKLNGSIEELLRQPT
jgi:peroxiredoxin